MDASALRCCLFAAFGLPHYRLRIAVRLGATMERGAQVAAFIACLHFIQSGGDTMPTTHEVTIGFALILALAVPSGYAATNSTSMQEGSPGWLVARSAQPWLPRYDPKTDWNFAHTSSGAKNACDRSENIPLPRADLPTTAELPGRASCNSEALYYGFAGEPDYVRARQCAYLQRAEADRNPVSGSVVLAMIYANGMGVKRSLPLATKFACEAGGAPAEIDARISHLQILAGMAREPGQRFDFCDDITSGYTQGVCAGVAATYRDVRREKAIAQIAASYTPAQQAAFSALQHAAASYFDKHAIDEVDLSGTARGAFWIEDIEHNWDGFVRDLRTLEADKLPTADSKAAQQADARLDAIYHRVLAEPFLRERPAGELPPPGVHVAGGTISREGIRTDHDLWLSYRDAWLDFAAVRKPALAHGTVLAWITDQRVNDLHCLLPLRTPGLGDCSRSSLSPSNMGH